MIIEDNDIESDIRKPKVWTVQQRISVLFIVLAGYIGASIFTHSVGLYVTFMTGNAEKNVLGFFWRDSRMSLGAILLSISFFGGVFSAAVSRRYIWKNRPYCVILLTAISMGLASIFASYHDYTSDTGQERYWFWDIALVAFGTGALNGAFTRAGETVIPVSYHSGSLVKLAQGLERHIVSSGSYHDWASYAISYLSFSFGAFIGGATSLFLDGSQMLAAAFIMSLIIFFIVYPLHQEDI